MKWDLFISYASEEKEAVAEPLANRLKEMGLMVWFDRFELGVGDRLGRKINEGLSKSNFGLVILSRSFFNKHYPRLELESLAQKEVDGRDVILPLWFDVDETYIRQHSLFLADRIALRWEDGLEIIASLILKKVRDGVSLSDFEQADYEVFQDHKGNEKIKGQSSPDFIDNHFKFVVKSITAGELVPVIGDFAPLFGRPINTKWHPHQTDFPPANSELASHLAQKFNVPISGMLDLARVTQYVDAMWGWGPLYQELRSIFLKNYSLCALQHFFANLPKLLREKGYERPHQLIVTTNYDDMLEEAFRIANEPFDLVIFNANSPSQGKFLHFLPDGELRVIERPYEYSDLSLDVRTIILKLNGSISRANANQDSFVITENHYLHFSTNGSNFLPVTLRSILANSHLLFLGYSQRDWNQRVLLNNLFVGGVRRYASWCIGSASEFEAMLWMKQNVDIIDARLEDYIVQLSKELSELSPLQVP